MNLKNLKKCNNPGFMLSEVLITLTIVSMVTAPVFMLISNSLRFSYRFYRKRERVLSMKNLLLEQMYRAKEEDKQEVSVPKRLKKPNVSLVYTRVVVKKDKMFEKIPENQLQNLCVQKVTATFGGRREKDYFGCLLYKPSLAQASPGAK